MATKQPNFDQNWPKMIKMAITLVVSDTSMQTCTVCFCDWVCAIGKFICDTPVHKGHGVTMATNFGTKLLWMHTNADNENVITYNRGFSDRLIQIRHFWLQGSKGSCHRSQIMAKIGKISQKWPKLQLYETYLCRVWFWDRAVLSGNSSVTLPYTMDKGALPWQAILVLKLL